ncbi:MAG TPA: glycoside hydrolase family 3 protein, partial [Lacipirellulaceae bacterium]|nr:glycoside hydrolase family 3 protein [Lacipirellulaceae bacterium]
MLSIDFAKLSLREKIAQLIFVRIGSNMPPVRRVEQDEERVAKLLAECPFGGLLLFNGGDDTKHALDRLQQRAAIPLLVASDIERGVGQQVKGFTLFPHAMAFDKLGAGGVDAVAEFAQALAAESKEVGIHIAFGPVADVSTNPDNPIINTRAFSESTERAAELTRAYVTAGEAAGLRTTAKHFPGHGSTDRDSHDSLPVADRTADELRECEFVPFQAAIDAGCPLIMTSHVSYPALDPSGVPATLSPIILNDILRKQIGFRGVVCSDSLLMAGVRAQFEREEDMALAVLNAGVDLLLDLAEPVAVLDHLCKCVELGRLTTARVEEALQRLWNLKRSVFGESSLAKNDRTFERDESASLATRVAEGALQLIRSCPPALPLDASKPLAAILLKPFETAIEPPEQPLADELRERIRNVSYTQLGPKSEA